MNHVEAFCLMLYRNEKTGREEWLWNSRDGVVPFVIGDPEDGGDMKHVDWFRDTRAPFFVPPVGSRVFLDMTETRARALGAQIAQRYWETDPAARTAYPSVEKMAEALWPSYLDPPGSPDILVVNSAMQEEYRARKPAPAPPRKLRFA